eukprot:1905125-Prymnesium_polylepis.1
MLGQLGQATATEWDALAEGNRSRESERHATLAIKRLQYAGVPDDSPSGRMLSSMHTLQPSAGGGSPRRLIFPPSAESALVLEEYDEDGHKL